MSISNDNTKSPHQEVKDSRNTVSNLIANNTNTRNEGNVWCPVCKARLIPGSPNESFCNVCNKTYNIQMNKDNQDKNKYTTKSGSASSTHSIIISKKERRRGNRLQSDEGLTEEDRSDLAAMGIQAADPRDYF